MLVSNLQVGGTPLVVVAQSAQIVGHPSRKFVVSLCPDAELRWHHILHVQCTVGGAAPGQAVLDQRRAGAAAGHHPGSVDGGAGC